MSSTLGEKLGLTSSSTWDNVVTSITNATVSTVLSFSLASTAYNSITFTWKNPASGGFAGVVIVGKTGSYPSSPIDGTTYYTGLGNNSSANGTSSTTLTSFSGGTTYYFRCWSYVLINNVKWYSDYKQATITTAVQKGQQIFTASGTFTVPTGVTSIDIFCVGGGTSGWGSGDTDVKRIAGGNSGFTSTKLKQAVTPGTSYTVTIGAGGSPSNIEIDGNNIFAVGGATSFGSILVASSGTKSTTLSLANGTGGSGGGFCGNGGSDGSNGKGDHPGIGQGTTTRAFAESSNTLYAGGGGGAGWYSNSDNAAYNGGSGGGGNGQAGAMSGSIGTVTSGSANTGSGGGGYLRKSKYNSDIPPGAGGSGICIVRWGY